MKIKKLLNTFLLLSLLISCKKESTTTVATLDTFDSIENHNNATILNYSFIPNDTVFMKNGGGALMFDVVSVIDSKKKQVLEVNRAQKTINISSNDESFFVQHLYQKEEGYYEILSGDTVTISSDGIFPKYIGSNEKLNQSNLYEIIKWKYLDLGPPATNYWNYYQFSNDKSRSATEIFSEFLEQLIHIESKEFILLDSLNKRGEITNAMYQLQKEKLKYKKYTAFFDLNLKDSLNKLNTVEIINQPDYINYKFYRDFLGKFINNEFKVKILRGENRRIVDHRMRFDTLQKSYVFNEQLKKVVLLEEFSNIANNFSKSDTKVYFEKLKSTIKDSLFLANLSIKYMLDLDADIGNDKMMLLNEKTESLTLTELLAKYKGKVVYIVFWASWCAPCRAAMPASEKLKEHYKDQDIEFVYISTDSDADAWKKATVDENLNDQNNNLLALNYPGADFYQTLKLTAIPRYIIFDKQGKLVHQNAPGPGSEEIKKILTKYIEE